MASNKHLDSKENHHQWYQVKYEVEGEIHDFDEDGHLYYYKSLRKNNEHFSHYI